LSFLHNEGSFEEFKSSSPFLSLTHGRYKFRTARNFALSKHNQIRKGLIYLYSLNRQDHNYFITKKFTQKLQEFGISWYQDIHNEIMLLNGMYPHYLLGVFEVTKTSTPKFIINPALYKLFEKNEEFDWRNGLKINQLNFRELVKELGYETFFYTYGDNQTYVADIENNQLGKTISVDDYKDVL